MSGYNYIPGSKKPIYAWNSDVHIDENAIKQLRNIANMPFVGPHISTMPDTHFGLGGPVGLVASTVKAVIPSLCGVDLGCLHGDTKIPLLNGTQKTLKELTDQGGEFCVYSIDSKTLEIAPGKAVALKTRENTEIIKVTISGGEEIVCTPDHEFMMSDGTYVEAKELKLSDSLMSLYRYRSRDKKVISVEDLEEKIDVYCLQVEKHHNFALSAGVFVHNCGMAAYKLEGITASDLPDNLKEIRHSIERKIPVGFGVRKYYNYTLPDKSQDEMLTFIKEKHPGISKKRKKSPGETIMSQFGSLGGGNHFIEVCLDQNDGVWLMLHSGSRGIGNQIGSYFINLAKQDMKIHFINLPDKDLAYLSEGTQHFDDYVWAVSWAQKYARMNRDKMISDVLTILKNYFPPFDATQEAVNCHHNYVSIENHFGKNMFITRKGAVSARKSEMGIIPGSMGAKSFIVSGKGNPYSFHSCSHGAGRVMSRNEAKKVITLEDHRAATENIECRKDTGVLDESPAAYKDIDAVMKSQEDLVDIVYTLKQVLCVKG